MATEKAVLGGKSAVLREAVAIREDGGNDRLWKWEVRERMDGPTHQV